LVILLYNNEINLILEYWHEIFGKYNSPIILLESKILHIKQTIVVYQYFLAYASNWDNKIFVLVWVVVSKIINTLMNENHISFYTNLRSQIHNYLFNVSH